MAKSAQGATWGDALIAFQGFAEHHPWRFLLTVPLTIGLALVIAVLALKIVVLGPLTGHKDNYERTRDKIRRGHDTRLP